MKSLNIVESRGIYFLELHDGPASIRLAKEGIKMEAQCSNRG